MRKIIHTVIELGLPAPIRILHVTDVHLTHASENDPEEQRTLAATRTWTFRREGRYPTYTPDEYFAEAISLAEREGALLVVTGDVMDLLTDGNIEAFHKIADGHDMMFTPGGHETQYICRRTMEEEAPYPERTLSRLKAAFPDFDMMFDSRVIGGINIVTANSAWEYFPRETVERFEAELARGYPMLVFTHVPPDDKLMGITEPYHPNVTLTAEDYRISNRMLDTLLHDPRVIGIVSGHTHKQMDVVIDGKMHYNTPGLFSGTCRLFELR